MSANWGLTSVSPALLMRNVGLTVFAWVSKSKCTAYPSEFPFYFGVYRSYFFSFYLTIDVEYIRLFVQLICNLHIVFN